MQIGFARQCAAPPRALLGLLFPPRCLLCDAEAPMAPQGGRLCVACRTALFPPNWAGCPRCGEAVASGRPRAPGCSRCRGARHRFDSVIAGGPYRDDLRDAVLRMKRRSGDGLSWAVGDLYAEVRACELAASGADMVVAVPMHWRRRLVRGTNSAEIVARRVAAVADVPLARGMLWRRRNTRPQSELPPGRRRENVRGAFGLRAGYPLQGATVLLVDDILTTGATCGEIASMLKRAGASRVMAAVLARAAAPLSR